MEVMETIKRFLNGRGGTVIFYVLILLMVLFGSHKIIGSSMFPTYHEGQRVATVRAFVPLRRGDVVVAYNKNSKLLIKRIAGVPGDHVLISNEGKVLVNGEEYHYGVGNPSIGPSFSNMTYTENGYEIDLQEKEYFLLGDNFEHSADSRSYGIFKRWQIWEKVLT